MQEDIDFMSDLEAAKNLEPARASVIMLFSVLAFLIFFFVWAGFSKIEQITRGSGQVVPSSEIQVVQSLEGGILSELLVQEGDLVEQGQILLRISDVAFASEERGAEARGDALKVKRARLQAEANNEPFELDTSIKEKVPDIARNEEELFQSRQIELENAKSILDNRVSSAKADLAEVRATISRLSSNRSSLQKELNITAEMVRKKAVPELEEIRLRRDLNDISGQISESVQRRNSLEAELRAVQKEREDQDTKFRSQALGELNDVETRINQLEENLTAIGDRVSRTELRSPVRGIVNKIMLKTIGGVVEPAMRLVEVVPMDDELKVRAKVPPHEIAFLKPGQDVKIKITAYDPQKYGALDGRLTRIGANSVTDADGNIFFEIEAQADRNYMGDIDNKLPITPGMVTQAEVITGKRTILEYLMKPILRARDRAFTER